MPRWDGVSFFSCIVIMVFFSYQFDLILVDSIVPRFMYFGV